MQVKNSHSSLSAGALLRSSRSIHSLRASGVSLLNCSTSMPSSWQRSTWSLARAMRGQTTTEKAHSRVSGGSWYASDLPPDVASNSSTSRPSKVATIASSWSGRKSEWCQYC